MAHPQTAFLEALKYFDDQHSKNGLKRATCQSFNSFADYNPDKVTKDGEGKQGTQVIRARWIARAANQVQSINKYLCDEGKAIIFVKNGDWSSRPTNEVYLFLYWLYVFCPDKKFAREAENSAFPAVQVDELSIAGSFEEFFGVPVPFDMDSARALNKRVSGMKLADSANEETLSKNDTKLKAEGRRHELQQHSRKIHSTHQTSVTEKNIAILQRCENMLVSIRSFLSIRWLSASGLLLALVVSICFSVGWPKDLTSNTLHYVARWLLKIPDPFYTNLYSKYSNNPTGFSFNLRYLTGIEILNELHDREHVKSTNLLSILHSAGYYTTVDYSKALAFAIAGSDLGDRNSRNSLAMHIRYGLGTKANPSKAARMYKQLSDSGLAIAAENYADLLRHGIGVERNPLAAMLYYEKAIDAGSARALADKGGFLIKGAWPDFEPDAEEGIKLVKQSIILGNNEAKGYLARYLLESGQAEEAVTLLLDVNDSGWNKWIVAQAYLDGLIEGKGIEDAIAFLQETENSNGDYSAFLLYKTLSDQPKGLIDHSEELSRLRKQIEDGTYPWALHRLAYHIESSRNEIGYMETAEDLYRKSVALGSSFAAYRLGHLHITGQLEDSDFYTGLEYLELSEARGSSAAQFELGRIYLNEEVGPIDRRGGLNRIITAASRREDTWVVRSTGQLFEKGQLVERDINEALKWYKIASEEGDTWAACSAFHLIVESDGELGEFIDAIPFIKKAAEGGSERCMISLLNLAMNWDGFDFENAWIVDLEPIYHKKMSYKLALAFSEFYSYPNEIWMTRTSRLMDKPTGSHSVQILEKYLNFKIDPNEHYIPLMTKAASNGDANAILELAELYLYELGDSSQALPFLQRAAGLGVPQAFFMLDQLFEGSENPDEWPTDWLTTLKHSATVTKNSILEYWIGRVYEEGLGGVEVNRGIAAYWFELASDNNDLGKEAFAMSLLKGAAIHRDVPRAVALIDSIESEYRRRKAEVAAGHAVRENDLSDTELSLPETRDLFIRSLEKLREERHCGQELAWEECAAL